MVELLLQHGADPNQRMANDAQNDPFKYLERRRASIQTVSSLASGSQTGDEDVLTQTALHIVCARLDYHQVSICLLVISEHTSTSNRESHGHTDGEMDMQPVDGQTDRQTDSVVDICSL